MINTKIRLESLITKTPQEEQSLAMLRVRNTMALANNY